MRNFLIILGIISVGYLAVNDTIARFEELDRITVNSTPSQEEMKSEMPQSKGSGIENKFQNNLPDTQNYELPKNRTDKLKQQIQSGRENYKKVPQSNSKN